MTVLVTGTGLPVTVVAHGLGATLAETRAMASGVEGTKAFPEARAHGDAPLPERPGYDELADDLLAVADHHQARQAIGVSMGAHTLLRIASRQPDRFDRLVLFLPAAIDTPVRRTPALVDAIAQGDRDRLLTAVRDEVVGVAGPALEAYVEARVDRLLAGPGLPQLVRALAADVPVSDRGRLAAVMADVLVLGQEGDSVHPADVARELAGLLPRSRVVVFDRPGAAWRERARLRELIFMHLRHDNG